MKILFVVDYENKRHQGYNVVNDHLRQRIFSKEYDTTLEKNIQEALKDPEMNGLILVEDKDIAGCDTFLVASFIEEK